MYTHKNTHMYTHTISGILDVIMKSKPLDHVLGLHVVHKVSGDVKATFDMIDKDCSGYIDGDELEHLLRDILKVRICVCTYIYIKCVYIYM